MDSAGHGRQELQERLDGWLRECWKAYPGRFVVVAVLLVVPFIMSVVFLVLDTAGAAEDVVSFVQMLFVFAAGTVALVTWNEMKRRSPDPQ